MRYKDIDRSLVLYPEHLDIGKVKAWLANSEVKLEPPFANNMSVKLTFDYGKRFYLCTGPLHLHTGLDIGRCRGAALLSSCEMVIRSTGYDGGGGGYVIGEIFDDTIPEAVYIRMFHVSKKVCKKGDVVNTGEIIGWMIEDSGKRSTGLHLHFEMLFGKRWPSPWKYAVNPRYLTSEAWENIEGF